MLCRPRATPFKINIHPLGVMVIAVGCIIAFALHGVALAKNMPSEGNIRAEPDPEEPQNDAEVT